MARRNPAPRIPPPKPPIDVDEAAKLLAEGLSHAAIGARLGYSRTSICRRLLEHGVRRERPPARWSRKWVQCLNSVWRRMRRRAAEHDVGVFEEWQSFDAFYDWARSSGYRPGLVLRRKDETGPYTPGNCRWSPKGGRGRPRSTGQAEKWLTEAQWKQAERLHVEKGLSCPEVARQMGVAYKTILAGLKHRGSHRPSAPRITGTPTGRKLYKSWLGLHSRCYEPKDPAYRYYGGKGARICREWDDFDAFYEWAIEAGWKPGLCLTRVARERSFSPQNCRWVTRAEAGRAAHPPGSTLPPRWTVTAFGETKGPSEWSRDRRCVVTLSALLRRLRAGMPPEDAITTPSQRGPCPPPTPRVRAFGMTKSVSAWSKDSRCQVTLVTLLRRLELGMPPEVAISARPFRAH